MNLKIEGPIPGGDLPECSVLRCTREGAYLATVTGADGWPVERLLCVEHREAITAGEPWRWDDRDHVFLMSSDAAGDGAFSAVSFGIRRRSDVDSVTGASPVELALKNDAGETLDVRLSGKLALDLARELKLFGHDSGEQG